MRVNQAIVTYGAAASREFGDKQIDIRDRQLLNDLTRYFPEALAGKRSGKAGGWTPYYIIELRCDDPSTITVLVKSDLRSYAVYDDWPLDSGFRDFARAHLA